MAYWREPKAQRSGEGQTGSFLAREEWPERSGEKGDWQPLGQGRHLRPTFTKAKADFRRGHGTINNPSFQLYVASCKVMMISEPAYFDKKVPRAK